MLTQPVQYFGSKRGHKPYNQLSSFVKCNLGYELTDANFMGHKPS